MSLVARLARMREAAEAGGVYFNPTLRPETIADRLARHEMDLPPEISALFQVCDGAALGDSVGILSLEDFVSMKQILDEIAADADTDYEEMTREYVPFAQYAGGLTLCFSPDDFGVYTLDIECSVAVKIAPDLESFLSALESALRSGGVGTDQLGAPFLPSWSQEAERYGIKEVWNTGDDE